MTRRLGSGLGVAVGSLLLAPAAARACAVCYGAGSDPMLDGTRWSVAFLLILTYLLLGGGGALFVLARRRARRDAAGGAVPRAGGGPVAQTADAARAEPAASFPQASTRGLV